MSILLGYDLDYFHLSDVSSSATQSINRFPLDTSGAGRLETDVFSQFPVFVVSALLLFFDSFELLEEKGLICT